MDSGMPPSQMEEKTSRRNKLMGKLFGPPKDKRAAAAPNPDVEAFLQRSDSSTFSPTTPSGSPAPPPYVPSATPPLNVPPPPAPPRLAKLDTASATRPSAVGAVDSSQLQTSTLALRQAAISPKKSPRGSRKGLQVRFADTYPDVMGEGGDECEAPTAEISRRKKAAAASAAAGAASPPKPPPPPVAPRKPVPPPAPQLLIQETDDGGSPDNVDHPRVSARVPTGLPLPPGAAASSQATLVPGNTSSARFLGAPRDRDENRKSFIEIQQAQMREAEGQALTKAARSVSAASNHNWAEAKEIKIDDSPPPRAAELAKSPDGEGATGEDGSPTSVYSSSSQPQPASGPGLGISRRRDPGTGSQQGPTAKPAPLSYQPSVYRATDAGPLIEAYQTFIARTRHLFELFRLHSETVRPLMTSEVDQLARAALWWFLRGRNGLEAAIRGPSPDSPQTQLHHDLDKQQAYANLAKAYWLSEVVIPEVAEKRNLLPDAEIVDATQALVSGLKKLSFSMKRNQLMPPEDAFLPQTIDKSIWAEYPKISQDMISLLTGQWATGAATPAMQRQPQEMDMMDAFPLGDTPDAFCFGRVHVDVFLMEQGGDSQSLRFPCLLSMVRPVNKLHMTFVLASQNGELQLRIQESKNAGPMLSDIRWRNDEATLELRLRRGYYLAIRCSKPDFRTLWSMYDFVRRVQSMLIPQQDEMVIFRSTLATFQYFDSDPNNRMFPKEPTDHCDVALFEKIHKEGSGNIIRMHHRGYRVAVVTGPKTRSLSGVHHNYAPGVPVQFGFMRGDSGLPGLTLKFESSRQKGTMVLTFNDKDERLRFHTLLIGTALDHDEKLVTDAAIPSFGVSQTLAEEGGVAALSRVPWRSAKIVNEEAIGEEAPRVNADKLRIVLDFKDGIMTDRVNVGAGELRIRCEVNKARLLRIWRQPQQDITLAVFESQVPKELPKNMAEALRVLASHPTIRTFTFESLAHMHEFQYALTGHRVVFDGLAAAFAIARRMMVVPIWKKWEAGTTRIQVVQQENKTLQMLVFFDGFSHARCMNLTLKGTDLYEMVHRSSKSGIKLVDAKFPLPGPSGEGGLSSDAIIPDEYAFVCLDLPDLPGEHDDITILFEDDKERDALVAVLPAPVKGSSRLSRVK